MQGRPLSIRALDGLTARAQMSQGLVAARLAFAYWRRAFPEKEHQAPLAEALSLVENFLASGTLPPDAKAVAEAAYRTVSNCDLPPGDIHRSSGFSVAHIAMAPWLYASGKLQKVAHNAKVAVSYSESIFRWAGRTSELEAALVASAQEARDV